MSLLQHLEMIDYVVLGLVLFALVMIVLITRTAKIQAADMRKGDYWNYPDKGSKRHKRRPANAYQPTVTPRRRTHDRYDDDFDTGIAAGVIAGSAADEAERVTSSRPWYDPSCSSFNDSGSSFSSGSSFGSSSSSSDSGSSFGGCD